MSELFMVIALSFFPVWAGTFIQVTAKLRIDFLLLTMWTIYSWVELSRVIWDYGTPLVLFDHVTLCQGVVILFPIGLLTLPFLIFIFLVPVTGYFNWRERDRHQSSFDK